MSLILSRLVRCQAIVSGVAARTNGQRLAFAALPSAPSVIGTFAQSVLLLFGLLHKPWNFLFPTIPCFVLPEVCV